jgi:hypothetical protein
VTLTYTLVNGGLLSSSFASLKSNGSSERELFTCELTSLCELAIVDNCGVDAIPAEEDNQEFHCNEAVLPLTV